MNTRPISIIVLGWVFVLFGAVAFLTSLLPLLAESSAGPTATLSVDWGIAELSRLLAMVGGVGLLYLRNWARWLLVAWMAYHVLIGLAHSATQAVVHGVLLVALALFLFRPHISRYFRGP